MKLGTIKKPHLREDRKKPLPIHRLFEFVRGTGGVYKKFFVYTNNSFII